ncbi:hypothetical protein CHCC15337_3558 [Bacillus paralicheniformis]|nr:hypothetical protein CHCC5021_3034 [Bacillus paralicheniformis]TWL11109.1 hypothetical protein CHCC19468_1943 [Bacillus paralicheniformis]TWL19849.1 hypothetical protein CHCC19467_0907 [Bacillus paralicheniformis]TWL45749.1 hypothetical protein CHCC15337_3558 [Bacillus paralicheniformis]TWM20089.1 hypothetical protein CHCC14821_1606 [Bacillus paralicheniformis]
MIKPYNRLGMCCKRVNIRIKGVLFYDKKYFTPPFSAA